MRHITLRGYDSAPCGGELTRVQAAAPDKSATRDPRLSLPILGKSEPKETMWEWVCERCGQRWSGEPLPDEAL